MRSVPMMAGRSASGHRHFVGRDHELATIAEACEGARAGRTRLVVVHGEAGIGKTALCEQAARRAERLGFSIGWGRCWADGGAPSLWPWPEVLAELGGCDAARLLAEDAGGGQLDPDRFARFAAVSDVLAGRARAGPLMIVVDDVHAADTATLLLARFLVQAIDRAPIIMLMTRRLSDGESPVRGDHPLDLLEREATILRLRSLDCHDTSALLAAHGVQVEDEALVPALTRLTEGSPLLLARVAMHAAASNALAGAEHVIDDVLGVLSAEHRDVMALAAILGMEGSAVDLATLSGGDPADVHAALDSASSAGLVDLGSNGWAFAHELVRGAALRVLTPLETMEAHARAIALAPSDDRPATVVRRAHHALAAAARSSVDADMAVACCRDAARVLAKGFEYERAAVLLDSAVALVERLTPPAEHVDVLLEWADALQVCGRLADARTAYERSVAAAEAAADPLAQARAALGLGGVWLYEHRGEADRKRVLGLQRAALEALPAHAIALRARLVTRLATEVVYDEPSVAPVWAALQASREVGDPLVLAEALSLSHHALLAPEHLGDRLPLAEELIRVASAAGDGLRVLFGLLWKAVDLFLSGDPQAERTLAELRARAETVGCRSVSYIVAAIDVMGQIRDGRLDNAEAAAHECFELGVEVGDVDATGYYAAHLLTIRWLQDRDGELLDLARDVAASYTLVEPEFAFRAAVALIAARAGLHDEADAGLRQLRAGGLAALPRSSTWLTGMVKIVEAAWTVGDADVARAAYPLLSPFADRPVMPSLAVSCFGSVERALGLGALTWGDAELAVEHLHRALERNVLLGNRPMTAITRSDLAAALIARHWPGDHGRATDCLRKAAASATEMGMTARAEKWGRRADDLATNETDPAAAVLRRDGSRWIVDVGTRKVVAPDLVGFSYLGSLLARPGDEIAAVDLCGGATVEASAHELVDHDTVAAYRRRVGEIDAQLESARRAGREQRINELEHEREALRSQLSSVLTMSGRTRQFVDTGERARTAVRKAIARAIKVIAASDDNLAAELRATISTGRRCSYMPDPARPRRWSVVVDA